MTAITTTSLPARSTATPGAGFIADNAALFGIPGKLANIAGVVDCGMVAVASSTSTAVVLTAAQFVNRIWDMSGSPGGAWTLTTPTAAQIIAAIPATAPKDGTYNFEVMVVNDDSGQTATVTAGANVTVLGTATVATNTNRTFLVSVNVTAGTVTMLNLGTMSL